MAYITASYAYATDKLMVLSSESISRTIQIGTDWSHLRIGMLMSVDTHNTYSAWPLADIYAFGLCYDTSSYSDAVCQHFLGFYSRQAYTYVFTSASTEWVTGGFGNLSYGTKIDGVKATAATNLNIRIGGRTGSAADLNPSSIEKRKAHFIDYYKSGPDSKWVMNVYSQNAAVLTDLTPARFFQSMTDPTQSLTSYAYSAFALPITESVNGPLNSINLYWNLTGSEQHVYAVGAFRFR